MMILLPFTSPFSMSLSGTTGSGKTTWIYRLLKHKDDMILPSPDNFFYFYGIWQDLYAEMEENMTYVKFREGLPSMEVVKSMSPNSMIVLDDLASCLFQQRNGTSFQSGESSPEDICMSH